MTKFPVPENEDQRLEALRGYQILDSLSEEEYDRITKLASLICGAPISLISLIDKERQWFKSTSGLEADETPRDLAFCQYTIMGNDLFEVSDATKDERFKENPFVTDDPNVRFYAGYPLTDPQGYNLGSLCVIDRVPRTLSPEQKEALQLLSIEVVQLITERRLTTELRNFEKIFLLSDDLISVSDTSGRFIKINPAFEKLLGWSIKDLQHHTLFSLVHPSDLDTVNLSLSNLKSGQSIINIEHRMLCANGSYKLIEWTGTPEKGTNNIFAIGRDITQVRLNEVKLAENESDLRAIFDNSHGFLCTHNLAGKFLSVNGAGAAMLGYTVEEIMNMSLFDIVPENRHSYLKIYLEQIRDLGRGNGQMLVNAKDGRQRTLIFNNVLELRPGKEPFVIGNALDITERKLMEQRLFQVTEMLELTNDVARVGGWRLDLQSGQLDWTAVTREIHEVPDDFIVTMDNAVVFYNDDANRALLTEAVHQAVTNGLSYELELQITTYKGRNIWVKAMGKPIFEEGVCKRLYGSFQDINKRKRSELEVIRGRALLSSFAAHTPAAVAMLDNQMNYVAVSNRWLDDYALTGRDIIGTSYYDHFTSLSDERKERHRRILKGEVARKEEDIYTPEGSTEKRFITWEMRPWLETEDNIGGMMIFTQDITAAVQQRHELNMAKLAAEQASVAKSDFLANMSHEIRTPLNGVIGFTDLVLKTDLSDTQQQYLSIVNQSAIGLLGIINDILDFSKIEAGKLELDIEECDLYEISSQAADIITYQVQSKGLEMLFNMSPDLPRFIWTDALRLKQIIINLLGNAAKFTERGEIELKIQLLKQEDTQSLIRFSVRDTGIGIKEENTARIFEAFTQEEGSTTKKYGGTGLGLSITNKLLKMMDSELKLVSTPGKGSQFYFDIWMQSAQGEPKEWEGISWIKRVMVVDDNENNREIIEQMLLLKDISTVQAKSGAEALDLLEGGEVFDLIIMDYHMPDMDGLETTRKIRRWEAGAVLIQPIILLYSSADDEKVIRVCDELQVKSRLAKPVKMLQLYETLSRLQLKEVVAEKLAVPHTVGVTDKKLVIMVADDNVVNMLLAKTILTRAAPNALIIEAENGMEAIACFKRQVPDLILMDVQMPEMNGYEATTAIRKLEKPDTRVPIIALTAGNVKNERDKCIAAGMDDFVVKPVIENTVVQVLTKWLYLDQDLITIIDAPADDMLHFDLGILKGLLGNDPEIIAEVLNLTKTQLSRSILVLEKAIDNQQYPVLQNEAHKLYGTAVSAGLPRLAQLARQLELAPKRDVNNIKDLAEKLQDELLLCQTLI
jgi:PAS domain S-box-containing protein